MSRSNQEKSHAQQSGSPELHFPSQQMMMDKETRNQHWRSRMEGKLLFQEPTAAVAMEGPRSQILPPIKSPAKLRKGAISSSAGPSFHPPSPRPVTCPSKRVQTSQ